jgi:uncharacterized protein YhhL (DUF1145 family)
MSTLLKATCLAIYVLAGIGAGLALPPGLIATLRIVAGVLLLLHVAEVLLAFRFLKRHPGPLVDSIALTLLFGFLHWRPLAKQSA